MAPLNDKTSYDDLFGSTDIPASDDDFSLEEILAEYGGSRQQAILRDVEKAISQQQEQEEQEEQEEPAPPPEESTPPEEASPEEEASPPKAESPEDPQQEAARLLDETRSQLLAQALDIPKPPHPLSMREVVGSTVDAVMDEAKEPLLPPKRRLFSRRRFEETENLYANSTPPPPKEPPMKPEPPLSESAACFREDIRSQGSTLNLALLLAILPAAAILVTDAGFPIPFWSGGVLQQAICLLVILLLTSVLCRHVFQRAVGMLWKKRFTSECLVSLGVLVSLLDCVAAMLLPTRTPVTPYAGVTALTLVFAQWGIRRESQGLYNTFRTASLDDEPPYLVAATGRGACKQTGSVPGFSNAALDDNASVLWQTILLPVVAVATLIFAGLSSLGQERGGDFLLNWSALLCTGSTLSLPLCWSLPFSRLAQHLQKAGCAVAGWKGAEAISRRKSIIVGDGDLFPLGTIQLNGVKVYSEELPKVTAYAAAMTKAAGCGLERLFEGRAVPSRAWTTSVFTRRAATPAPSTARPCCWALPPSCGKWISASPGIST